MQINITHQNFDLTEAIKNYTEEKFSNVEKYINDNNSILNIEIGKTSLHHKHGNVYEVKAHLVFGSRKLHIENVNEDVYASIDEAKDKLVDEIAESGDRERSVVRKIARKFKNIIKREKREDLE